MGKFGLYFTDLHIHNYRQFDKEGSRLQNCLRVLDDVFSYAHKKGITSILFGGDLFDQQKALPTSVVNETIGRFYSLFKKYPEITFYAVTGNHDQASKSLWGDDAVSALIHLQYAFEKFWVIDNDKFKVGEGVDCYGIPYYEYAEHFIKALEKQSEAAKSYSSNKRILMIHQTPSGLGNPNIPVDVNFDNPLFAPFDMVWCGHIHSKQELSDRFIIGGSPIHRDLGDEGQEKGFWIFSLEDPAIVQFIPLKGYPQYRRLADDEITEADAGNFIVPKVFYSDREAAGDATMEEFGADLKATELIKNYWNTAGEGDEELLTIGLSFIK